ncbi:MAG TPA: hypothetical protein ENJ35_10685 [Gammaproteobacteria bacterium]|nr:hypothetical protein [Gammaproteobacteria bacterium]
MWLFATYEVNLPKPILVKTESEEPVVISVNLKGWDSEVKLFPNARLGRIKPPTGNGWYYSVSHMEITVTRDGRLGDEMVHGEAAKVMVERLLVFLQFKTWRSLFAAIEMYERFYSDADSAMSEDEKARLAPVEPQLDLVADYEQQNMHDYMSEFFSRQLSLALLRDATRSIEHRRSRRACLELTMACEAALGMRLESVAQAKVSMGDVFNQRFARQYEEIVQLFQARDAIKQSGNGLFRFVSALRKRELEQQLTHWQAAVECLTDWLNAMNKGLQEAQ